MFAVHLDVGDIVLEDGWDVDLQYGVSVGVLDADGVRWRVDGWCALSAVMTRSGG